MIADRTVQPGEAVAIPVDRGRSVRITAVEGRQVATFAAFARGRADVHASPAATMEATGRLFPTPGSKLYSPRFEPLLTLVEDTVGRHDLAHPPCRRESFEHFFALEGRRGCFEALRDALAAEGVATGDTLPVFNLFMRVRAAEDGSFEFLMPEAAAGTGVVLAAACDLVVAVAACPVELTPVNGCAPSAVRVVVE